MISSFVDGRVRLRSEALKNPETVQKILSMTEGVEGVISVNPNLRTGSLLIYYNPEVIDREMLKEAADAFEEQFGNNGACVCSSSSSQFVLPCCLKGRRGELNLLGLSLGATVLALLAGRQAHIWAGGLFCLLSAKHVYDRRKQMF